jgi:hypothetical protein
VWETLREIEEGGCSSTKADKTRHEEKNERQNKTEIKTKTRKEKGKARR